MALFPAYALFSSCGSGQPNAEAGRAVSTPIQDIKPDLSDKGIGPINTTLTIADGIKPELVEKGKMVFEANCTACHNTNTEKKIGPGLKDITKRRSPEWIMNMILNPMEMTQKDPIAKELLAKYIAQMTNQNLGREEARAVYEFLRNNDK